MAQHPPADRRGAAQQIERRLQRTRERSRSREKCAPIEIRRAELRRIFRGRLHAQTGDEPLKQQIDDAVNTEVGDHWLWAAGRLGKFLKLTLDEKRSLGIRTIRCCDVSPAEVAAIYARGRQERQNRRRRERRARAQAQEAAPTPATSLPPRAEAIAGLLSLEYQPLPELADRAATLPPFLGDYGELLDKASMQRAARRAMDALLVAGVAEEKREKRKSGTDMRLVRRAAGGAGFPVMRPPACPGGQDFRRTEHGRTTERPLNVPRENDDKQPVATADNEMAAPRAEQPENDGRTGVLSSAAMNLSAEAPADDDLGIPDFLRR